MAEISDSRLFNLRVTTRDCEFIEGLLTYQYYLISFEERQGSEITDLEKLIVLYLEAVQVLSPHSCINVIQYCDEFLLWTQKSNAISVEFDINSHYYHF